jgi:hypothetical protein
VVGASSVRLERMPLECYYSQELRLIITSIIHLAKLAHLSKKRKEDKIEKVCKTTDITTGTMKGFIVNEKPILISNFDGKYCAVDSICTHMRLRTTAPLAAKNQASNPASHQRRGSSAV